MDPRLAVVERRLAGVERILAVTGGKGGIGKSSVASTLALCLAETGRRVGLLDLDLTGPSDHVLLGIAAGAPEEVFGIEPVDVDGLRFMSISCFIADEPAPLRGVDVSNAVLELLAITRWGALDVLVVDMPPGLGDVLLDAARLLRRAEHLVVANGSRVVLETVRKNLQLLERLRLAVTGVVENALRGESGAVRVLAEEAGVRFLGTLPLDDDFEAAAGDRARIARTQFAAAVRELGQRLFSADPPGKGC